MTGLLFVFLSATLISQSFMDAMSVVIILFMLTARFAKKTTFSSIVPHSSWKLEALFLILWLATVVIGLKDSPQFLKNLTEWKWLLNLYFLFWFLNYFLDKRSTQIQAESAALPVSFWQPLHWVLLACFTYGAISYISGIDLFKQTPLTHGKRFGGPFDDPMNFAHIYTMYCAFLAPFVLQCLAKWQKKTFNKKDFLLMTAFALTGLSILLSLTRGAWMGLFTSIVVMFFIYNRRWGFSILISGLLGALVLYGTSDTFKNRVDQALYPSKSYDNERYNLWRTNWEMFKDHPAFGVGHGDYKLYLSTYFEKLGIPADHFQSHAHNQYLQFLSNTGLIGFLFYMIFIGYFLVFTYRAYQKYQDPVFLGALGAQVAFHIGSMTECNFERAKVRLVYLFFCALTASLAYHYSRSKISRTNAS
jgi:O-antigen ligase